MRDKLRKVRKEQHFTQDSLSKKINIHRTYYSMIESEKEIHHLK